VQGVPSGEPRGSDGIAAVKLLWLENMSVPLENDGVTSGVSTGPHGTHGAP